MNILSVSQLNSYLRELLESDPIVHDIWIQGEISNLSRPSSGHLYFTLKEGEMQIRAVAWKSNVARLPEIPRNGDAIIAHGYVSYYEVGGQLQLYVDMIQPAGLGMLHLRFEELKQRLELEGLFDETRKRPLPSFPRRIGIVTSPTGAALQDMLNILRRRFPLAEVILAPCQVQGSAAANTIVEALYELYTQQPDVIIVARGGGSIEDLWPFNEEIVARAVFASPVPLVSGVGHETDVTMIDYVADLRAPTPSAAAELVTPDISNIAAELRGLTDWLHLTMQQQLAAYRQELDTSVQRLNHFNPSTRISRDRQNIDELMSRAETRLKHRFALQRAHLQGLQAQLTTLSPKATLERGYAIVQRSSDQHVITGPEQIGPSDTLMITLRDGTIAATPDTSAKPKRKRSKASLPEQDT
jgi:exodeoxyribonuclease VII large subunit